MSFCQSLNPNLVCAQSCACGPNAITACVCPNLITLFGGERYTRLPDDPLLWFTRDLPHGSAFDLVPTTPPTFLSGAQRYQGVRINEDGWYRIAYSLTHVNVLGPARFALRIFDEDGQLVYETFKSGILNTTISDNIIYPLEKGYTVQVISIDAADIGATASFNLEKLY